MRTGASNNGDLALEGPASRSSRHLVYVDWVVGFGSGEDGNLEGCFDDCR